MRLNHAIFTGPLDPMLELQVRDTPEHYATWPGAGEQPETLPVWKVHEGEFPEVDVGMVSDHRGFEDSPDAEWISGGINSKGPDSVALGRQGNYFLWGFYGAPDRMTESAKRVFLNTIVYMHQFDGDVPLVEKVALPRSGVRTGLALLAAIEAGERPELEERVDRYLERYVPVSADGRATRDLEAIAAWLEEHEAFLLHDGKRYELDRDLVELGRGAGTAGFLDALLERLAKDSEDALAARLAARYVDLGGASLAAFVEENRAYLFFSEVGGYRWFVDTNAKRRAAGE